VATEVVIPVLGVTVESGIIVQWFKKEGDLVEKGESLFEVETEKVITDVESPASGTLAKILLPIGEEVPILSIVAIITDPGEELSEKFTVSAINEKVEIKSEDAPSSPAISVATVPTQISSGGPVRIVPAARKLAGENSLILTKIKGTGHEGIILYQDVKTAITMLEDSSYKASTQAQHFAENSGVALSNINGTGVRGRIMTNDVKHYVEEEGRPQLGKVIPMSRIRKTISQRMSQSAFTAPHIYFFSDIYMDPILNFRREVLSVFESTVGLRLSINDLLIKTVALTISKFPMLNATIQDDKIQIMPEINVCLAVGLKNGLITPAIVKADTAGLADIVQQRTDLVRRARTGNLTIDEIERGTFTISSLAKYDITHFTGIINPPQSAILSLGKTREELFLNNGSVHNRKVATFGLSVDHRIIDGEMAAKFLENLKSMIETPNFAFLKL
jgi:pyruvate dehydrogenase E2 component (dihydrolipoamide acetyltransferase)